MAISKVLTVQAASNPALRFTPEALTLTAACLWLTNGLHARPEDGSASRKLMDAVLPVTEADGAALNVLAYNTSVRATEDGDGYSDRKVPYNPYGCIFLRRLKLVNIPRMRYGGPILIGDAFKYWFDGLSDIDQLKAKYLQSGIIDKSVVAGARSTTSKRKPPLRINISGQEEHNLFNLGALGHTLPSPVLDNDSDLEDRPSPPPDNDPKDLDTMLSALWRQFVSDLTSKSPNPHGRTKPSYLKLTDVQRQSGSEEPYRNRCLSDTFHSVYYRNASTEEWERCFKWLFPPEGFQTPSNVQNYTQSPYFRKWMDFLATNEGNKQLICDVRKDLFKRIRKWSWMPCAQSDRMWITSQRTQKSNPFIRWPSEDRRPAPYIILRSNIVPIFTATE